MDGPSPQPALKGALLPGVIKKKKKSYNQRGGGRGQSVPFIHNIVNIHSLYYMCFSLVFACLSVSLGETDLRTLVLLLPIPTFLPHTGNRAKRGMVPKFRRSTQEGLLHSGSRVLYVCLGVYVHVCTPGTCVQLCTKGKGFTVTEAGAGGVARGKACRDG